MSNKKGFTLVELSIVLVIIGLIVGGVVGGSNLIQAARLKSVITEFRSYQSAVNIFRDKYDFYPGDLPTAYSYWPSAGCTNAYSNVGCNGNGDGRIEQPSYWGEGLRAWQQMSLAGMIAGSYTGSEGSPTGHYMGINVPESKIKGTGWWFRDYAAASPTRPGSYLELSKLVGNTLMGSSFTPADAQSIDTKIDDGKAQDGKVYGSTGSAAPASCDNGSGGYNNTDLRVLCLMRFFLD